MEISGKTVLITGATGGMGRAFCRALGEAGAAIAMLDVDENSLRDFAEELTASGIKTAFASCDIRDAAACQIAIEQLAAHFGGIDILMNNAGITHRSLFSETQIEVLEKVMAVNYFGAVNCTKAALPYLRQSKGTIVVTSSIAGFTPLLGRTGYSASKYALHGFFESLRTELIDDGVKILLVCPGFTATGIENRALSGDGSITKRQWSTTGKIHQPADVANAIINGIRKEKRLLVLSTVGKLAYWIGRLFPKFYEREMRKRLRHEFFLT